MTISNPVWEVYVVIVLLIIAAVALVSMLIYRHRHKTNIETNLLLKQMRMTSRMRGALDVQKDYLDALDRYHSVLFDDWEHIRAVVLNRSKFDIGDMRTPPEPKTDMSRLLANIERL